MTPPPKRRTPRYRVVVYELDNDHQTQVMDATATGYQQSSMSPNVPMPL